MDLATYAMNKFKDIKFEIDTNYPHEKFGQQPKYNAAYSSGELLLSIAYGGGCYGAGPVSDSYEIALFKGDDFVKLTEYDDVAGWISADGIEKFIHVIDDNPGLDPSQFSGALDKILQ